MLLNGKKSKVQLSEFHGIWGTVTWEQRHRWHRMHALWNSGTSSTAALTCLKFPLWTVGTAIWNCFCRLWRLDIKTRCIWRCLTFSLSHRKFLSREKVYRLPPTVRVVEFIHVYECGCTCRRHTCAGQLVLTFYLAWDGLCCLLLCTQD